MDVITTTRSLCLKCLVLSFLFMSQVMSCHLSINWYVMVFVVLFVQVISYTPHGDVSDDSYAKYFEIGQFRDTVPLFDGKLVIRFVAADYHGEVVTHCECCVCVSSCGERS